MKKYVLSESQVKKVVDNLIQEQSDMRILNATLQCFLNHKDINIKYKLGAKLGIDGKAGPGSMTEDHLRKFQQAKIAQGYKIEADGQWGYRTQETLADNELYIWKSCVRYYERA